MGAIGLILATLLALPPLAPESASRELPAATYLIDLQDISRHRIHVEMTCARSPVEDLEIWMPVWTQIGRAHV